MQRLTPFFDKHKKAALAFSGGTDSSLLLYAGIKFGCDITAYYVKTLFQPQFEMDDAIKFCDKYKAKLKIIELDVLKNSDVLNNDAMRCYYCKKNILKGIAEASQKDGYELLIDGTNASDKDEERPGSRAVKENNVISPLREYGIDKENVRLISKKEGLFTWDKPSYSCLATRIKQGTAIDKPTLAKIEEGENYLFSLGLKDFRLRTDSKIAKIELREQDFTILMQHRQEIYNRLAILFDEVNLSLKAR